MKKLILFLLISICVLNEPVQACGPYSGYTPNGLRIFRVAEEGDADQYTKNLHDNIAAWKLLVSGEHTYSDVYHVVYKSSTEDMQYIRNKHKLPASLRKNAFAKALRGRDDLTEFLITAKSCEHARSEMNDPWYYPSHNCPHINTLKEVINTAIAHSSDTLLHDRYALQQMRAQLSLGLHQDNVDIWENYASHLPAGNVLRTLMTDYAVGAYENIGDNKTARELALKGSEYFDNSSLLCRIESELCNADLDGSDYYYDWEIENTRRTFQRNRETAIAAIQHPETHKMAEWYYTLAYIDDVLGDDTSSENYLRQAERANGDEFIRESIHLFRIYRDAKSKPVNDAYEAQMLTNLRWLEERLVRDCPAWTEEDIDDWSILRNYSRYYWNDMLRRIGIGIYAQRLQKAGRTIRAIEVLNYSENLLFKHLGLSTMKENHFGYTFQALDTRSASTTMQYIDCLKKPKDDISRFLQKGSYADYDWLYNIAGTLYMRESQFAEATKVLNNLSASYTGDSIYDDPFVIDYRGWTKAPSHTTRRTFAAEMVRLENQMKHAPDANDRADAQMIYAIAIRNMFTVVWRAVAYGKGSAHYMDSYTPDVYQRYSMSALERSDRLLSQALQMYTDDERAADAELRLMNFRTVVERYPHSAAANHVRSACENYIDFGLQSYQKTAYLRWYHD